MVLKLDKPQGIVAAKKKDCYYSLDYLFNDPTKSEIFDEDPTLRNISTFHRCLNTLGLRGERTKKKKEKRRYPNLHQKIKHMDSLKLKNNMLKHHLFDQLLTQPIYHTTEAANF